MEDSYNGSIFYATLLTNPLSLQSCRHQMHDDSAARIGAPHFHSPYFSSKATSGHMIIQKRCHENLGRSAGCKVWTSETPACIEQELWAQKRLPHNCGWGVGPAPTCCLGMGGLAVLGLSTDKKRSGRIMIASSFYAEQIDFVQYKSIIGHTCNPSISHSQFLQMGQRAIELWELTKPTQFLLKACLQSALPWATPAIGNCRSTSRSNNPLLAIGHCRSISRSNNPLLTSVLQQCYNNCIYGLICICTDSCPHHWAKFLQEGHTHTTT